MGFNESRFPVSSDTFAGWVNQSPANGNTIYTAVLYAQARLESGNFGSNLARNHYNYFGMRPATSRDKYYDHVYDGANGKFASYADGLHSVLDRVDWDNANRILPPQTIADIPAYIDEVLRKGYDSAPNYKASWLQIIQQYLGGIAQNTQLNNAVDDYDDDYDDEPKKGFLQKYGLYLLGAVLGYILAKRFRIIR